VSNTGASRRPEGLTLENPAKSFHDELATHVRPEAAVTSGRFPRHSLNLGISSGVIVDRTSWATQNFAIMRVRLFRFMVEFSPACRIILSTFA
jgi:hypothetical protein